MRETPTAQPQPARAPLPTAIPARHAPPVTLIEPSRGWVALGLRELWSYRELLLFLVWRDIKVRYKQTVLGVAWAIIQPLFTMIIFTIFFGRLAGIDAQVGALPYPLFAYAALVPWTFFANGLSQSSDSLVGSANLIKKVYFPRLVIPIATVLAGIVDFLLAFAMLLGLLAVYHDAVTLSLNVLLLPFFVLLALATALGVGLWFSALNVQYRDVRYVVPFLVQVWLFATPIAYPSSVITDPLWRALYGLNPMAGVVEGFRWALLGTAPPGPLVFVSAAAALGLLVSGLFYFRRMERTFADVV